MSLVTQTVSTRTECLINRLTLLHSTEPGWYMVHSEFLLSLTCQPGCSGEMIQEGIWKWVLGLEGEPRSRDGHWRDP